MKTTLISRIVLPAAMLAVALTAGATDYYVSTVGSDSNSGLSSDQALATLGAAIGKAVRPGDNVYIAAGTYTVHDTEMMGEAAPYKLVYDFTHSGAEGRPISFVGVADADGNRPVFDFSQVRPGGFRVTAFHIKASWLTIRNIEMTGVQNGATAATDNVDVNGYGHTVVANLSYAASARRGCVGWLSADSANCTVAGNSFHYVNGRWQDDNVSGFRSTQFSDMTHPRDVGGNYSAETVGFCQADGVAFGSDFAGYAEAVATAKASCGAMTGTGTGIAAVSRSAGVRQRHDTPAYNIAGQRLTANSCRGIVIRYGKKAVIRR